MEEEDREKALPGWLSLSLCSNPGGRCGLHVNCRRLRTPCSAPVSLGRAVNRAADLVLKTSEPGPETRTHTGDPACLAGSSTPL